MGLPLFLAASGDRLLGLVECLNSDGCCGSGTDWCLVVGEQLAYEWSTLGGAT